MKNKITVIGSANTDLVIHSEKMPKLGETLKMQDVYSDKLPSNPIALINKKIGDHSNGKNFSPEWSKNVEGLSAIPAGAIISKTFDNVFAVGRAISSEPMLTRTYRMMNTCMTTGEAAGLMAYLSIKNNKAPKELDYSLLKKEMIKNNFILE